jgi:hypothetical protein
MRSRVGSDSARNDFKVDVMAREHQNYFPKPFDAVEICYIIKS